MTRLLAVATGSALGGVARYLVGLALSGRSAAFPLGTLAVNVAGGLLIGFLARLMAADPVSPARLFLTVGFCGGFTTFSAFSLDAVRLLQDGEPGRAGLYVVASVVASVAAVWVGLAAAGLTRSSG